MHKGNSEMLFPLENLPDNLRRGPSSYCWSRFHAVRRRQRNAEAGRVTPASPGARRARETPGKDVPGLSSPRPGPAAGPARPPTCEDSTDPSAAASSLSRGLPPPARPGESPPRQPPLTERATAARRAAHRNMTAAAAAAATPACPFPLLAACARPPGAAKETRTAHAPATPGCARAPPRVLSGGRGAAGGSAPRHGALCCSPVTANR